MSVPVNRPTFANKRSGEWRLQVVQGFPAMPEPFPEALDAPSIFAGKVSDAVLAPGGVTIHRGEVAFSECFSSRWELSFHHHLHRDGDSYTLKRPLGPARRIDGLSYALDFMHLAHYGHFVVDVLPSVWVVNWAREVLGRRDLNVIVPRAAPGFMEAFLEALGIPEERLIRYDEPIACEQLLVATRPLQLHMYATPLGASTFDRVRSALQRSTKTPGRIYVSRSKVGARPLRGEAAVEGIFRSRGFVVIHPQLLSVRDQITLFANADLVAGPSGSNMFNLAFQRRVRAAFVMVSPALIHRTDVLLTACTDTALTYFVGDLDDEHPAHDRSNVHTPWKVDLQELAEAADRWLASV